MTVLYSLKVMKCQLPLLQVAPMDHALVVGVGIVQLRFGMSKLKNKSVQEKLIEMLLHTRSFYLILKTYLLNAVKICN